MTADAPGRAVPTAVSHLIRRIDIPMGAPWDQDRAARLKALAAVPLSPSEVAVTLVRMGRWAPRRPGLYVACFVKIADLAGQITITETIDGRRFKFVFRSAALERRRWRERAIDGAAILGAVVAIALALSKGVSAQADRDQDLRRREAQAAATARTLRAEQEGVQSARLLRLANAEHGGFSDLAADLAWAARAKTAEANLQGLHWHVGVIEVTSAGADRPFSATDRSIEMRADDGEGLKIWRVGLGQQPVQTADFVQPSIVFQPPSKKRSAP